MTSRLPVAPSPGPLEEYATRFDDLFRARAERKGFRRYLEGLLLPAERNKTLIALANTESITRAQRKEAQSLRWFLTESGWAAHNVNERRLELLFEGNATDLEEGEEDPNRWQKVVRAFRDGHGKVW